MNRELFAVVIFLALATMCSADCALDHLLIGCNADGIAGTADDNTIFVDCAKKYRHSDPNNETEPTWLNWFYPLYDTPYGYVTGEPGFDVIGSNDPNRQLTGTANVDYRIIIECISIKPGFSAEHYGPTIIFDQVGDYVNYSGLSNKHIDLDYYAPSPAGGTDLHWITFYLYDELGKYLPAAPVSIVFVKDPPAGDLVIDGKVDMSDLAELCYYWLQDNGSRSNDYYERADANRDGKIDFIDFCLLAENWMAQ